MTDNKNENGDAQNYTGKRVDPDFFAWPHFSLMILGFVIQYFSLTAAFAPTTFPGFLGPVASFGTKLGLEHPHICLGFVIILYGGHLFEAYEASKVCQRLQLTASSTKKWILSTCVFGFFSLTILKSLLKKKSA